MLRDKVLVWLVALVILALSALVPGFVGYMAAIMTGIPGMYYWLVVISSTIAFVARWFYLRSKV